MNRPQSAAPATMTSRRNVSVARLVRGLGAAGVWLAVALPVFAASAPAPGGITIVAATYGHGVDDGHGRRLGERIARRNEQGRETDDGWEELAAAHEQARFLYKEARAAYDRVRGGVDAASIVPEGER